jgi:hypothetical protein
MTVTPKQEQPILVSVERQLLLAAEGSRGPLRSPSRAVPPGTRRPRRLRVAGGLAAAVLVALVGSAILGSGGSRQFDVAAAVYRALKPGTGVRHVVEVLETPGPHRNWFEYQRWSTSSPPSERTIGRQENGHGGIHLSESAIAPGGTWTTWSPERPSLIERTEYTGTAKYGLPELLRGDFSSYTLRFLSRTHFAGQPADRLEALPRGSRGPVKPGEPPTIILVNARTFLPLEVINYRGTVSHPVPAFIFRYPVYEELPATARNLALLKMAPHPGASYVKQAPEGPGR